MIRHGRSETREYLERLQAAAYRELGERTGLGSDPVKVFERFAAPVVAPDLNEEGFNRAVGLPPGTRTPAFEAFRQRILDSPVPTRFEEPRVYIDLLEMGDAIEQTAAARSFPIPFRPLFGSLPSRNINAQSIYYPASDEFIVLFEHGLYHFAFEFSKVLSLAMPVPRLGPPNGSFDFGAWDVHDATAGDAMVADAFCRVLESYVVAGNPFNATGLQLDLARKLTAGLLIRAMESLVVGHEYAHIIRGPFTRPTGSNHAVGGVAVNDVHRSVQQEFDADESGLNLSLPLLGGDPQFDLLGAEALFGGLECVDRALRVLTTGREADAPSRANGSHPDPASRRDALRKVVRTYLPDEADVAIAVADKVRDMIDSLWTRTRDHFTALHERGVRPSPLWQ